jgi:PAS domain S-box-containing protein
MREDLIEVIGINEANCTNCHQCIAVCPVKFCSDGSDDVVKFNNNLCIGCGRCIEVCIRSHGGIVEKSARFAIDDSEEFEENLNSKEIIALVAPSAHGNFKLGKLITALKKLGVRQVFDVSLGAEITVACYHEGIKNGNMNTPVIATPCPAIVKYIELHHPGLIKFLAPVGSPVYNLSVYVRSLYPEAELAFISPCLAKRREFQDHQMVKYNVTYRSLQRILQNNNIDLESLEDGEFDSGVEAGIAANFSSAGGLKESYLYHYPETPASSIARVDGPSVFSDYLVNLETAIGKRSEHLPMIIDILSCEKGCNMGVGCTNKLADEIDYLTATRSERAIKDREAQDELKQFLTRVIKNHNFEYKEYEDLSRRNQLKLPTASQLQEIYTDMHKVEEKDFRNCAACGYNSCYQMAVAIYNGLNKAANCHLYQEKELRIEQEALQRMHSELTNVFDTLSDGVIVLDKAGRVSSSNRAAREIMGYSGGDLLGMNVVDLFSGKAPGTLNLLETGEPFADREILLDGKRGKIHATATGKPIRDTEDRIVGATIFLSPIAQVKQLVNKFGGSQASFTFDSIIGEDQHLKNAISLAMMAATNSSTVLLQAESGTGKEVFAQAIHNSSFRSGGPFVAINCAAIPRDLVGSELFGYAEGAFTGAKRGGRPGRFELANRGTLLLDEIGDMPLEQQAVLLRAIQEKAVVRVGGDTPIQVDVRIIAATNQDLLSLVDQGRFRADLYYRLNVIKISIPPLRERRGDIKHLFNYFLSEMSARMGRSITSVDPLAMKYLENYDWPGNVRELQNVLERMLLVSQGSILTVDSLPREIITDHRAVGGSGGAWTSPAPGASEPAERPLDRKERKKLANEQEKKQIIDTLDECAGNVSMASAKLGISRNTMYKKMKKYNIVN